MKLRVDGGRIFASLADEGRHGDFVVEALFRCSGGRVVPSIVFVSAPGTAPQVAASDMRRVLQVIGDAQVVPCSGRPFPLCVTEPAPPESSGGKPKTLRSLKKLGVIGIERR